MSYKIKDIIDIDKISALIKAFSKIADIELSIKDLDGKVLAQTKWQRICTDFHGTHPETAEKCIQSDAIMVGDLKNGKKFTICKCLNGLIDTVSPIIVDGKHVANLFAGQFLFEAPDMEFFRKQAKEFGFDEDAYLKAVAEIPIISKSKAKTITSFMVKLTGLLGEMGLQRIKQLDATEALRQEQDFEESLVNTAQTIVLVLDLEGKIVHFNPYMEEISGYSLDEVRGKNWFETFLPEEYRESIRQLFLNAVHNIQTKGNVNAIITKDGSRRDIEWYDKTLKDASGKAVGVLAIGQDITDRKNMEEALRRSKSQLQAIIDNSPAVIYLKDIKGRYILVNRQFETLFHVTRDQAIGKTDEELFGKKVAEPLRKNDLAVLESNTPLEFEEFVPQDDGKHTYLAIKFPLPNVAGNTYAVCGISTDITERKRAAAEIETTKAFLDTVVDMSPFAMWISDRDGTILRTNHSLRTLLNLSNDEIIGKYNVLEDMNLEKQGVMPKVKDVFKKHVPARFCMPWRSADAGEVNFAGASDLHIDVSMFPILDTNGKLMNVVCQWVDITEQRQAEGAIRESEEIFRVTAEQTGQMVYDYDPATGKIKWEGAIEDLTGQTFEEMQNCDVDGWAKMIHPDDRTAALDALDIAQKNCSTYNIEYRFRQKDRRYLFVEDHGVFLPDSDGKAVRMLGSIKDITDRQEAQQAIKDSEQRYRMLFDGASEGILVVDIETKGIVYANYAICEMLGYAEDELKKMDISAIHPPEEWERVQAEFEAQSRGEKIFALEIPCLRQDGSIFYADINTAMIPIDGRECNVGFITDITDRKIAEDQIFSHARFPSENPNPVLRVTRDGHVLYANKAGEMLLTLAGDPQQYISPEDWGELIIESMDSGQIQRAERTYETQTFALTFTPILDAGYVNIYAHDVTARRKLEDQLRQSEKMKMVGQLAAGVAHDFRNQLTVVKGYGEMLLDAPPDGKKTREYAQIILAAVDKATTVTSQLLAFGRKESLNPKIIDLSEPISELARSLPKMVGEDIKISITSSAKPCYASIDATLLEQAIMNLVINSRHAMPIGGELTIRSTCAKKSSEDMLEHPGFEPGFYCVISVHDTGIGMSSETVSRIFEPFFTTKEVGMGTGMGLAMVHGFVSQSGGFIEVDSKLNKGTTFKLYFPSAGPGVEKAEEQIEISRTLPTGSETLLAVEDEEQVRHILVTMLRELGYTVLEAANADEAIPLGEHYEGKISLLVTDVIMPKMDGVELAMRLRKTRPNMPVLFLSGYAKGTIPTKRMLESWSSLLDKPIDRNKLAKAVRDLIDDAKKVSP